MSQLLVYKRARIDEWKSAVCALQFLTSLLISSGQIVQYLRVIHIYGGSSSPASLRRRWGERTRGEEAFFCFISNHSLSMSLQEELFVNSSCFYLVNDYMNDIELYFLKYYCLYVVGTCILLNIKDCCYTFRFHFFLPEFAKHPSFDIDRNITALSQYFSRLKHESLQ